MGLVKAFFEFIATVLTADIGQLRGLLTIRYYAPSALGLDPNAVLSETSFQVGPRFCFFEVVSCHLRHHVPKRQITRSLVPLNFSARRGGTRLLRLLRPSVVPGHLPPLSLLLHAP
jgi:hypothetical protein